MHFSTLSVSVVLLSFLLAAAEYKESYDFPDLNTLPQHVITAFDDAVRQHVEGCQDVVVGDQARAECLYGTPTASAAMQSTIFRSMDGIASQFQTSFPDPVTTKVVGGYRSWISQPDVVMAVATMAPSGYTASSFPATATFTNPAQPTQSSNGGGNSGTDDNSGDDSGLTRAAIIGIAVAVVGVILTGLGVWYAVWRDRRKKKEKKQKDQEEKIRLRNMYGGQIYNNYGYHDQRRY